MAMRCFWPPESSVGRWNRKRGSTRTSAESLSTLARTEPALAPPSLRTARVRIWRVLQAGLSVESGFWKTIWMARSASCERLPAVDLQHAALEGDRAGVRREQAGDALGQRGLAAAGLADEAEGLALAQAEGDVGDGGELLAAVLEGAHHAVDVEHVALVAAALLEARREHRRRVRHRLDVAPRSSSACGGRPRRRGSRGAASRRRGRAAWPRPRPGPLTAASPGQAKKSGSRRLQTGCAIGQRAE